MERIEVTYGGRDYIVVGRKLSQLRDEIWAMMRGGGGWLPVREPGERSDVHLLLTRGARIDLHPIPES